MSVIRITKEFSFEMAHALDGYDGACSQIHGHSYRLFVTVKGMPRDDYANPKYGMVMDFGELKKLVNRLIIDKYDHSFVIRDSRENEPFIGAFRERFERIILTPYQPTCENMIADFADVIRGELPPSVELVTLRMHETATSFAEWHAEDN